MGGKKEFSEALLRDVKHILRNERHKRDSFNQLTLPERKVIEKLNTRGFSQTQIATILGRNRSTISRELKRKNSQDYHRNRDTNKVKREYDCNMAHNNYLQLKKNCGRKYKIYNMENEYMLADLEDWIFNMKCSPASYLGYSDTMSIYGGEPFPISLKTIYRYINKGILSVDFADMIHKLNRKIRKKRVSKKPHTMIRGISIEKRPGYINNRSDFGHWEGDTVVCKDNLECLFTLVERRTRFGIIKKIKTRSPSCVLLAMQQIQYEMGPYFNDIFKSITFDNGPEFCCHKEIASMGVEVYFTHPYSSYERGSNENFNGIVRRFFPKKTNFSKQSELDILWVQDRINQMPRRHKEYYPAWLLMWFECADRNYIEKFPFNPMTQENYDKLKKYGKAHILYNPNLHRWVVSKKFKQ